MPEQRWTGVQNVRRQVVADARERGTVAQLAFGPGAEARRDLMRPIYKTPPAYVEPELVTGAVFEQDPESGEYVRVPVAERHPGFVSVDKRRFTDAGA